MTGVGAGELGGGGPRGRRTATMERSGREAQGSSRPAPMEVAELGVRDGVRFQRTGRPELAEPGRSLSLLGSGIRYWKWSLVGDQESTREWVLQWYQG
ncbi:hypothetical protein RJT34_14673 [Clitoria ternatea]|uniref:Uncharacterized protein n=1 Tax=Clitoria ternatea TaxID=43366 RepID=A0AAN9JUD9_CLITE